MKPPVFPKELNRAVLGQADFAAYDEYSSIRFDGGQWVGQASEYVVFNQVQFQGVVLSESHLYAAKLMDTRFTGCSLANVNCERIIAHRTEFSDCRLIGLNITEGYLQDVRFRDCDMQLARLRFCSFKTVTFDRCNLKGANFQGADLSGVHFSRCDLSEAEMSQATLVGTDFRNSTIDGLRVGAKEVEGAIVDPVQAAYMASLLGLVVRYDDK